MVNTVSASDNATENENIPIEYEELQIDDYDPACIFLGTYVEYPMKEFNESQIALVVGAR